MTKRIVLVGFGTVGSAVYDILTHQKTAIQQRIESQSGQVIDYVISHIVVRNKEKYTKRYPALEVLFTEDFSCLSDGSSDMMIELVSGDAGIAIIRQALLGNMDVVTANKQALFKASGTLEALALEHNRFLLYEAAVAGAIPILQVIPGLASGNIQKISGILNGSTNYILTRVSRDDLTVAEAIAEAQDLGYLEADPTLDLDGWDALYKLGILVYLATGTYPCEDDIRRVGIQSLTAEEVAEANRQHKKYKLVAQADLRTGHIEVAPRMLGNNHPLYAVDDSLNAISLAHDYAGELVFQGRGAGGDETASAVISNVLDILVRRNDR